MYIGWERKVRTLFFFFLGEVDWCERGLLALNLAEDLSGDGWVEVDGVVPQALRGLVAFATATLEGFPHTNLCAVAVLGVVFDTIHILKKVVACRDEEEKWGYNYHF